MRLRDPQLLGGREFVLEVLVEDLEHLGGCPVGQVHYLGAGVLCALLPQLLGVEWGHEHCLHETTDSELNDHSIR